jgi:hypothetical protein
MDRDPRRRRLGAPRRGPVQAGADVQSRLAETGHDPADVARLVVRAVRENRLWVFTHAEYRDQIRARYEAMLAAHDWSGAK